MGVHYLPVINARLDNYKTVTGRQYLLWYLTR